MAVGGPWANAGAPSRNYCRTGTMDRRLLLSLIAGTAVLPHLVHAVPLPPPQPHRLNLSNPHTGETFNGIYRDDNGPIPRVMEELSVFLRDFRSGEQIDFDVNVIDFLSH